MAPRKANTSKPSPAVGTASAGALEGAPATPQEVVVQGPAQGFRRAGRTFGPEPVVIALEDLAAGALEALMGEPMLNVQLRDAAPAPDSAA